MLQGYLGVSLFLVLSGFCLSYRPWQRRAAGEAHWFSWTEFARARCRRILLPYYAALFIFAAAATWWPIPGQGRSPSLNNLLDHLTLIQNMTPFAESMDGPFWSLAMEWQWYLLFPLVVFAVLEFPMIGLLLSLGLCAAWHLGTHDLFALSPVVSGALPARLFEFCCGVLVARIAASEWRPRFRIVPVLVWMALLPLLVAAIPPLAWLTGRLFGPADPFVGVSFASIVLLGQYSPRFRGVLSWQPLVQLGVISYSVYLIHGPVMSIWENHVPGLLQEWVVVTALAIVLGTAAGILFHLVIERPSLAIRWGYVARCLRRGRMRAAAS
jgi:peptidoglycan/LPS O-acetylase OafA/YrhL